MIATTKPFPQANNLADQAAQGADSALASLQDKVQDVRDQAGPAINRMAAKAQELASRSADAMRDRSQQLKEHAYRAQDVTVGYIKDEPLKSILIAAAAGAALMALVQLLTRDRD
jgi:ElaB/YqjD/DUF883 family membrane-anchored ribosome-binding protein